jgi:L-amino acid N-acyltransferase YncA
MGLEIRLATPSDAPAIASIHVRSWQHAYRDIVPDAVLDSPSVAAHEQLWRHTLESGVLEERVWVAENDGKVVGFCATGPSSDDDAKSGTAEVAAIYLEPDQIGTGVGRTVFEHAVNDLRDRGMPHGDIVGVPRQPPRPTLL